MTQVAPVEIMPPATAAAIEAKKPRMVRVKLLRHYRPGGDFEVVGHWKPEIVVKNQKTGKEEMISPAEFIEGENSPPPQAGVGFATKIWAGTVIRLTTDEAKAVKSKAIGEIEIDDD